MMMMSPMQVVGLLAQGTGTQSLLSSVALTSVIRRLTQQLAPASSSDHQQLPDTALRTIRLLKLGLLSPAVLSEGGEVATCAVEAVVALFAAAWATSLQVEMRSTACF